MNSDSERAENPTGTEKVSVGFLLSGGGRTLVNLLAQIKEQNIPAKVELVIASKSGIGGLKKAEEAGIPWEVHPCRTVEESREIFDSLDAAGCQFAILGGWLRKLAIPKNWQHRVINIHPSLLPRHGGKGCYGDRVHKKVLEAGDLVSGCTVHFVDDQYDRGPIILQEEVTVHPDDDVRALAARVFDAEMKALPAAVDALVRGQLHNELG